MNEADERMLRAALVEDTYPSENFGNLTPRQIHEAIESIEELARSLGCKVASDDVWPVTQDQPREAGSENALEPNRGGEPQMGEELNMTGELQVNNELHTGEELQVDDSMLMPGLLEQIRSTLGTEAINQLESLLENITAANAHEEETSAQVNHEGAAHGTSIAEFEAAVAALANPPNSPPPLSARQMEKSSVPSAHAPLELDAGMSTSPEVAAAASNQAFDLSAMPKDPALLSWLTEQVSKFQACGGAGDCAGEAGGSGFGRLPMDNLADDPAKLAERERIREENRERKKRWREVNQDRNKDNDLRCRVTKRASKLYGPDSSVEKSHWMEQEFNKRRAKREAKENARKYDSDGRSGSQAGGSSSVFPAFHSGASSSFPATNNAGNMEHGQAAAFLNFLGSSSGEDSPGISQLLASLNRDPDTWSNFLAVLSGNAAGEKQGRSHATQPVGNGNHGFPDFGDTPFGTASAEDGGWGIASPIPDMMNVRNFQQSGLEGLSVSVGEDTEVTEEARGAQSKPKARRSSDQSPATSAVWATGGGVPGSDSVDLRLLEDIIAGQADIPDLRAAAKDSLGSGLGMVVTIDENGEIQIDTDALEKAIAQGEIDLQGVDIEAMMGLEEVGPSGQNDIENIGEQLAARVDEDGNGDLAMGRDEPNNCERLKTQLGLESTAVESDSLHDIEVETRGMSTEQLNALIAGLGGDVSDSFSTTATNSPPPEAKSQSLNSPPHAFNGDVDTSAQYTPENLAAIISVLMGTQTTTTSTSLPPPPPPAFVSRGTKRSASASAYNSTKRHRLSSEANGMTPAVAAYNQLSGLLQSNGINIPHHHQQPVSHIGSSHVSPAYAASFGNSDTMNKRLMAMKPPPYRPGGGSGAGAGSGAGGAGGNRVKKSGDDEKKIKAMGFPPLMAGIKRK